MTDHKTIMSIRISRANKRFVKELGQVFLIVTTVGFIGGRLFVLKTCMGG